jgi:hypothetical protein
MTHDTHDTYADLARSLSTCQGQAERLGLKFLATLLAAALLEVALQAEGGHRALDQASTQFETMLRLKLRLMLGASDKNVVLLPGRPTGGRP